MNRPLSVILPTILVAGFNLPASTGAGSHFRAWICWRCCRSDPRTNLLAPARTQLHIFRCQKQPLEPAPARLQLPWFPCHSPKHQSKT